MSPSKASDYILGHTLKSEIRQLNMFFNLIIHHQLIYPVRKGISYKIPSFYKCNAEYNNIEITAINNLSTSREAWNRSPENAISANGRQKFE